MCTDGIQCSLAYILLTCIKLWASEDLEFRGFDINSSSDENLHEASLVSVLYPLALTVVCGFAEMGGGVKKGLLLLLQLLLDEAFLEGVDDWDCD